MRVCKPGFVMLLSLGWLALGWSELRAGAQVVAGGFTSGGLSADDFTGASGQAMVGPSADNSLQIGIITDTSNPIVTTLVDEDDGTLDPSAGTGTSLREAINFANGNPGVETIKFAPGLSGTISLSSALPALSSSMTIEGPGASVVTVARNSAAGRLRLFTILSGQSVTLAGLTLSNGFPVSGFGGGILNGGTLIVNDCVVSGNLRSGISNTGTLTLNRCTVAANNGIGGGGLLNSGTLTLDSCAVTDNSGGQSGILNNPGATLTLTKSTLSGNSGSSGGGGLYNRGNATVTNCTIALNVGLGFGGGIYNDAAATLNLTHSTLAGNSPYGLDNSGNGSAQLANAVIAQNDFVNGNSDVLGSVTSLGYNLISRSDNSNGWAASDQLGLLAAPLDPKLEMNAADPTKPLLKDNGGLTQTIALLAGSPAINGGNPGFAAPPDTDQRGIGFARVQGGRLDIGAFESNFLPNQPPVNGVPGPQTTLEDTPLVFSAARRISVSDPDAGTAAVQVNLTSLGGRLLLASTANLALVSGSNNSASMTYTGTITDLNAALDGLSFIPTPNGNGAAHLTIVTNDLGNTGSGGPQTDTDTVNITVTPVNDPPVANNESYTVAGGGTLTVDAAHGVLANDTDVDTPHANLTAVKVSDPASGALTLNADGSFTYTPGATISNNGGSDSFTYKANDGTDNSNLATVSISVTANQAGHGCDGLSDVTNGLQITRAALRYNAITGRYVQQVTVKNNGAPITGPVFLVLDNLQGGTLYSPSGTVGCFTLLLGDVYRTVPGNLGTGGSATVNLEFVKTGATVTYTPRVLAGSGTP